MKETDLYEPCKTLLESMGYGVKAEIGKVDIAAIKDDYLVIIELKLNISLKLVYQAIDRQKLADKVYIALPKKVVHNQKSNVKHFINLLKRLEIGLITVDKDYAEVMIETFGFDLKRSISSSKKKKEQLLKEFSLRKSTSNVGGSNGKKITVYKEKVILIAEYLETFGEKSPIEIIRYTGIKETPNILRKNYYLWFFKVERGVYKLSEIGHKELLKIKVQNNK